MAKMHNQWYQGLLGIATAIMIVIMTALSTWLFKIDDRQFNMRSEIVTRSELRFELDRMESNIDTRLENIEEMVKLLIDREREQLLRGNGE